MIPRPRGVGQRCPQIWIPSRPTAVRLYLPCCEYAEISGGKVRLWLNSKDRFQRYSVPAIPNAREVTEDYSGAMLRIPECSHTADKHSSLDTQNFCSEPYGLTVLWPERFHLHRYEFANGYTDDFTTYQAGIYAVSHHAMSGKSQPYALEGDSAELRHYLARLARGPGHLLGCTLRRSTPLMELPDVFSSISYAEVIEDLVKPRLIVVQRFYTMS